MVYTGDTATSITLIACDAAATRKNDNIHQKKHITKTMMKGMCEWWWGLKKRNSDLFIYIYFGVRGDVFCEL